MNRYFLNAATGAAIGFAAWGYPPFSLPLCLLLPFAWARSENRLEAFCLAVGYFLFFAWDIPFAVARFFPETPSAAGYIIWLADAAIIAAPWAIAWQPGWSMSARSLLLVLLALLPPLGLFAWGTPFVTAGALFPGFGAAGIVLTGLAIYLAADVGRAPRVQGQAVPIIALVATSVIANAFYAPPPLPSGWVAISTEMGELNQSLGSARVDRFRALRKLADAAIASEASVVVFPEEIAPDWSSRWEDAWALTSEKALRAKTSIILGADERRDESGTVHDSLMLIGLGYSANAWHEARVPMPLGSWRPWSATSIVASPFAFPFRQLQGKIVSVSVCYEDFLVWPHLRALFERPNAMISVANNWMVRGRPAETRQRISIEMTSRLIGAPLLRAQNR